jgi:hypothetical protein
LALVLGASRLTFTLQQFQKHFSLKHLRAALGDHLEALAFRGLVVDCNFKPRLPVRRKAVIGQQIGTLSLIGMKRAGAGSASVNGYPKQ